MKAADPFSRQLGRRLRWLRVVQDITLAEMERRSGILDKTLQRYERGGISIPASKLAPLCDALGISPMVFCGVPSGYIEHLGRIIAKEDAK